ncbi:MAG: acyl-CoA dehydrogenase family protein [Streptosporangiaceae bacterium]
MPRRRRGGSALGRGGQCPSPVLRTRDRYGRRVDGVDFHPSWHRLMEVAVGNGLHSLPWRERRAGAHVARAATFYVWNQVEGGHGCPISMTCAAVPALRADPDVAAKWVPRLTPTEYDFGLRPPADKAGCLMGMGMTEKQGGSDVRAGSTRAHPLGGDAYARRVGPEGRGVARIIEMVAMPRLDCVTGSAALMRQAVAQATHHATYRRAFGEPLVAKPLMRTAAARLTVRAVHGATAQTPRPARATTRPARATTRPASATIGDVICAACRERRHDECPDGSWCDCQHGQPGEPTEPATGAPGP